MHTSSGIPRSRKCRRNAGSSTARMPCPMRSAPISSAAHTDAGPTVSPACAVSRSPAAFANRYTSPNQAAARVAQVVAAMETKPRIPVIWLHGLECTCCSESFIRSSHPIAQDVVLNMISLDYDDTLQAAAGFQVEEIRKKIMKDHPGEYILAVEGNAPTRDGGVYCTVGGDTFLNILLETAEHAKAIVAWGSCASNGCVQAARPNPTGAKPVFELIPHRTIINVPGCPPIAEVMTGVLTYILDRKS